MRAGAWSATSSDEPDGWENPARPAFEPTFGRYFDAVSRLLPAAFRHPNRAGVAAISRSRPPGGQADEAEAGYTLVPICSDGGTTFAPCSSPRFRHVDRRLILCNPMGTTFPELTIDFPRDSTPDTTATCPPAVVPIGEGPAGCNLRLLRARVAARGCATIRRVAGQLKPRSAPARRARTPPNGAANVFPACVPPPHPVSASKAGEAYGTRCGAWTVECLKTADGKGNAHTVIVAQIGMMVWHTRLSDVV